MAISPMVVEKIHSSTNVNFMVLLKRKWNGMEIDSEIEIFQSPKW